jgi:hypothetical protein
LVKKIDHQEMYSFAYGNGTYVAVGGALEDGSDGIFFQI